MRWYLCSATREVLRTCEAPDRSTAIGLLRPTPEQCVVSAASYAIPLPKSVTDIRIPFCVYCRSNIAGEVLTVGAQTMHRSCYDKHQRDTRDAERKALERERKRRYREGKRTGRVTPEERKARVEGKTRQRNATIINGIERRRLVREALGIRPNAGLKPKKIVIN